MSNARKKVIVRRFAGDTVAGYLPLSGFVRGVAPEQMMELLDLSGRIVGVPLREVKMVSFVRDFNLADTVNPERLTRRTFLARPRNEGLWVRVTFRAAERGVERVAEVLEGLAATDVSLIDAMMEDGGLHLSPPDNRSNTQRIFVPRAAMAELQVLGVVTSPTRVAKRPPQSADQVRKELQESLFQAPTPPNTRPN
jgi:hypothetical protein